MTWEESKHNNLALLSQAKHSMLLLSKFYGDQDFVPLQNLYMKFPDVVESALHYDCDKFLKDISYIICLPIASLAEALIIRVATLSNKSPDVEVSALKDVIKKLDKGDHPFPVKATLVQVCNFKIEELKKYGVEIQPI